MKQFSWMMVVSVVLSLFFSACATTEPEGLESSLRKQDEKMRKSAERSRTRSDARKRKWKEYSSRADARYDRWVDSIMD